MNRGKQSSLEDDLSQAFEYTQEIDGEHNQLLIMKVKGRAQDLTNFQTVPKQILSVLNCSDNSPYDIPKVSQN